MDSSHQPCRCGHMLTYLVPTTTVSPRVSRQKFYCSVQYRTWFTHPIPVSGLHVVTTPSSPQTHSFDGLQSWYSKHSRPSWTWTYSFSPARDNAIDNSQSPTNIFCHAFKCRLLYIQYLETLAAGRCMTEYNMLLQYIMIDHHCAQPSHCLKPSRLSQCGNLRCTSNCFSGIKPARCCHPIRWLIKSSRLVLLGAYLTSTELVLG